MENQELALRVAESLVVKGDLSGLKPAEKIAHYVSLCEQAGLNPASNPFALLKLNGKEVLYATRTATDQLSKLHGLTRRTLQHPTVQAFGKVNLIVCVVEVTDKHGRTESATGSVPLPEGAENVANALMKCETKAKRRATLALCGLGVLDETELDTIPDTQKVFVEQPKPQQLPATTQEKPQTAADFLGYDGKGLITFAKTRTELLVKSESLSNDWFARWRTLWPAYDEPARRQARKKLQELPDAVLNLPGMEGLMAVIEQEKACEPEPVREVD